MHDWGDVASDGFAAIFRAAEETMPPVPVSQKLNESKDCQMKRARSDHDGSASNEGRDP
jgi:hypothetical protein